MRMKRVLCLALALCMLFSGMSFADEAAEQLEKEIGAFEITAEQRRMAQNKRDAFMAMQTAVSYAEARYGVHIPCREIICDHSPRNPQCLGSRCPYHTASE